MIAMITGASGQVGRELIRHVPDEVDVVACDLAELDISDPDAVKSFVETLRPALILNCAAYTAVDRAEQDVERAFAVNGAGARNLASAAAASGSRMIHYSTDFVFDGSQGRPYMPSDDPAPVNAYGRSKLKGEEEVRAVLGQEALIIRTSWVYAVEGANFVNTMLRLFSERDEVRVVADQIGVPTNADDLAQATWKLATDARACGTLHVSNSGVASWYDFAVAIRDEAQALGLLEGCPQVVPIPTLAYPTPATRPHFSVLNAFHAWNLLGAPMQHWRSSLRWLLHRIKEERN